MLLNILFLPVLLLVGLITSYEDIKYSKIRNKWTLFGLLWGVAILLLLPLWNLVASPVTRFFYFNVLGHEYGSPAPVLTVHLPFFIKTITNLCFASAASFLMWKNKIWAAGDAKLFIVYSLLIPVTYYWKTYLPFFPSFVLLVNIFLIVFIYMLSSSFYYSSVEIFRLIKLRKKFINPAIFKSIFIKAGKALVSMIPMFLFVLLISLVLPLFGPRLQNLVNLFYLQVVVYSAIIIFSAKANKIVDKFKWLILVCLLVIFGFGLFAEPLFTIKAVLQTLYYSVIFMVIFTLFQKMINLYVNKNSFEVIKADNLKPGMELSQDSLAAFGQEFEKGGAENMNAIKEAAFKKGIVSVKINKFMPLAFWMFLGVIVTVILKESIINFFLNIFRN